MKKALHLNLKRKWFDMILSGEKVEEYRDISDYWVVRLVDYCSNYSRLYNQPARKRNYDIGFKDFSSVIFSNGYAKDRDQFTAAIKNIVVKEGTVKCGAEKGVWYFTIQLGEVGELNANKKA